MESIIRLLSYNIDGMPEEVDLFGLPWYLRFIGWIYLLIKGTSKVRLNDNDSIIDNVKYIGNWLCSLGIDIIGLQEDFDYHDYLMDCLYRCYYSCRHLGSLLGSGISIFPYLRLKSDGLSVIMKGDRVKLLSEDIISWKKSYGYFSHGGDMLIRKGFRFCELLVDGVYRLDLYVIHMDADFYGSGNDFDAECGINIREYQLKQLVGYILNRYRLNHHNPIIIMGDTNCSKLYSWDVDNIEKNLFDVINSEYHLDIKEFESINGSDVNRLFYINDDHSRYELVGIKCNLVDDIVINDLSGHRPLICEFKLKLRK